MIGYMFDYRYQERLADWKCSLESRDPITVTAVVVTWIAITAAASYIPAPLNKFLATDKH